MMLMQRSAFALNAAAANAGRTRGLRPLRSAELDTEQRTAAASSDAQGVQATISALDSLLPAEPPKQASVPSTSQPTSSIASSSSQAASSSSSNSPWGQIQKAADTSKPAARQSKQSLERVMAFEGFAPEVVNGRAAMLGFFAAMVSETHGDSLFSQLVSGGGILALGVITFVTVASFAPAVRQVPFDQMFGKDKKPASFGPFTATAELINGRAAMLGLLTLFFLEGTNGQPFFL